MPAAERTRWILEKASELGFDLCGVAPADDFANTENFREWLGRGYAGEMKYLQDPRRVDVTRVLEGARRAIVVALNYNTPYPYSTQVPPSCEEPRGWISRYAWGDDYHEVLGEKLRDLAAAMREEFPETFRTRAYVDTGPIVERLAAKYAGLGWAGKNTCLINEELGSWLFLGVILTDLELEPTLAPSEAPPADLCGNCRLCIDACPTGAIVEPYVLDARRCISYLTIELRGAIPEEFRPAMGRMVFGCDICQDVCPWNSPRRAPVSPLTSFQPRNSLRERENGESKTEYSNSLLAPKLEWLASISEEEFREVFSGSAVKRTKWRGLVRNACVALGNSSVTPASEWYPRVIATLERLAASPDSLISEHARWALTRLGAAH
jgi:epoxyqueuosine reductase